MLLPNSRTQKLLRGRNRRVEFSTIGIEVGFLSYCVENQKISDNNESKFPEHVKGFNILPKVLKIRVKRDKLIEDLE
jgi:hypothetical protein